MSEIESLIAALMGVIAARVAMGDDGQIEEIHVLSDQQLHPKQIVRNIESALSAGLGLSVDRRMVSVAQVRAGDDDDPDDAAPLADPAATADGSAQQAGSTVASMELAPPEPGPAPADHVPGADQGTVQPGAAPQPDAATDQPPVADQQPIANEPHYDEQAPGQPHAADTAGAHSIEAAHGRAGRGVSRDVAIASRYVFVGYDARTQPDLEAACRVTIRRGNEVISGNGTGPSTMLGRAQAAARAVFAAIAAARRDHALGLEGATLVERHGRSYVLVAANATSGRDSMPLTGAAAMHRSPEEAAILASLQATNRWAELDG